jgi:hypothetical protein
VFSHGACLKLQWTVFFGKVVSHFADKEDAQPHPRLFVADWCGTSVLTPWLTSTWLGINDEETDTPSHNREYLKYGSGCEHRKFQNHTEVLSDTDFPS